MKQPDWRIYGKRIGGAACACCVMIAMLCGIVACLITKEYIGIDAGKKIAFGAVLLLIFLCSRAAAAKLPHKRLPVSVSTAGVVLLVLVFLGGGEIAVWPVVAAAAVSLLAGLSAGGKSGRRR